MMATLEDLQAPVAAQADYRAVVLAAVNALGVNQRGHALGLAEAESRLGTVQTEMAAFRLESGAALRSVDEQLAEIKDLISGRRNGR